MNLIRTLSLALLLASVSLWSAASPGAHGPNGEHLDTPNPAGAAGAASPRLETKTEQLELVATLTDGKLSMLIDRFETNEPLLDAAVEVESGGLKAKARFNADIGDYSVDDAAMLKLLGKPGSHPLVITVLAGQESDLLDGTLNVATAPAESAAAHGHAHDGEYADVHAHGWGSTAKWLGGGLLVVALLVIFLLRKRGGADEVSKQLSASIGDKA